MGGGSSGKSIKDEGNVQRSDRNIGNLANDFSVTLHILVPFPGIPFLTLRTWKAFLQLFTTQLLPRYFPEIATAKITSDQHVAKPSGSICLYCTSTKKRVPSGVFRDDGKCYFSALSNMVATSCVWLSSI